MKLGGSLERRRGRRRPRPYETSDGGGSWARVSRNVLLVGVGLVVFGWLVGYLLSTRVLFPAPPPPGDLFDVPDLRGLALATARERIAGSRLTLGTLDSLQHPSVAAGLILGQSPLPGQVARAGSPVRLTVSIGPRRQAVPDVVRLDEERARLVLETSDFLVSTERVESDLPRGRVVEVFPPPDSVVALPARVTIRVSTGPPVVAMPFVLGLAEQEARLLLDSLGLVVSGVEEVFRYGRDQGIVVQQEPASDIALQRGSPVRLWVGRRTAGGGTAGGNAGGNNDPTEP